MSVKQYEKFYPLFTNTSGDHRSDFFLSELKHAANKSRIASGRANYAASDLEIKDATHPSFIARYFDNKEGINDDKVHPAWTRFVASVITQRADNTGDAKVLDIIRSVANPKAGSVEELVQLLLSKLLAEVKDNKSADIKGNPSNWGSAFTYKFKDVTDLATELASVIDNAVVPTTDVKKLTDFLALTAYADNEIKKVKGLVPLSAVSFNVGSSNLTGPYADIEALSNDVTTKNTGSTSTEAKRAGLEIIKSIQKFIKESRTFSYKLNEFFVKRVLADAAEGPVPSGESSWFSEQDDVPKEYKYYRKSDGRLYMKDPNGVEHTVDSKSDAVLKLSVDAKCIGTGFSEHGGKGCGDYLQECLEGGDVSQCKEFLKTKDFWINAEAEVNSMLPPIALKTLKAFEFDKEEYVDETAGRKLYRVISYTQWITKLAKMVGASSTSKLSEPEYKNIAANDKLQGYLEMLVKKVNTNPGILNKDYTGSTDANMINNPNAFNGTRLNKMGLSPRYPAHVTDPSSFERLRVAQQDVSNRVRLSVGLSNTTATPFTLVLTGGSGIENNEQYLADASKQLHAVLGRQYLNLVARLDSRGKKIAAEDDKKITKLIDELKQKETKLVKLVLMTEKYASLLEVHGQHDPAGVITIDHLKEFVDQRNQYFQRVSKKQSDLISIIKSISEALNKDTPKEDKKTESKTSGLSIANLLG